MTAFPYSLILLWLALTAVVVVVVTLSERRRRVRRPSSGIPSPRRDTFKTAA